MSTFKEIIARVDENKPNAFSNARKFQWLVALDGKIAVDVFLMGIEEVRALPNKYPEDMGREPLVGYPHEELYDYYLEAKIDAANGEYDRYQNSMELYNESYNNFVRWFCSVYRPAQGGGFEMCPDIPTYYITAYGLAVKAGFRGSMDEWLASLKGERGDTGKSAYEYALEAGYTGTEEAFRESQLNNGKTAYEYAVEGGYAGTVEEFRVKMAAEYATKGHNHNETYAAKGHNHDETYAPKSHNHDETYAAEGHDHDGSYLKVAEGAVAEVVVLKRGLHYGTETERPEEPAEGQMFLKLIRQSGGSVAAEVESQGYGAESIGAYSASEVGYAGYNGSVYYGYVLRFSVGTLPGDAVGVIAKLLMHKGIGNSATLRYALCTSDENKASYVGVSGAVEDACQIAAGTVIFEGLSDARVANSITFETDGITSDSTYYLFLWADGNTGVAIEPVSSDWGDHSVAVNVNGDTFCLTTELFCEGYWVTAAQEG